MPSAPFSCTQSRVHGCEAWLVPRAFARRRERFSSVGARASLQATPEAEINKRKLDEALQGLNRGIFGVRSEQQRTLHELISHIEKENPLLAPVDNLHLVAGSWKLIYSTIRILGTKRSKLGLREFVQLGDLYQDIDVEQASATNKVEFSVSGFSALKGALTIVASFDRESDTRVTVAFEQATLQPQQLEQLFQKNYDLLLAIFNPAGWLDITYVDDDMRIGRDDKENIFVLRRVKCE